MEIKKYRLLKIDQVLEVCAISNSTLYASISRGEFPKPVKVGVRAVAWRQVDVLEWIESRPSATNPPRRHTTARVEGE